MTSINSLENVVLNAFPANHFEQHQNIFKSASGTYVLSARPSLTGYSKLTLDEIISLITLRLSSIPQENLSDIEARIHYMAGRKIQKSERHFYLLDIFYRFVERVCHYFGGYGFQTTDENACVLEQKLRNRVSIQNQPITQPSNASTLLSNTSPRSSNESPTNFRVRVFQETLQVCEANGYQKDGRTIQIDNAPMLNGTFRYEDLPELPPLNDIDRVRTQFEVIQDDTFNVVARRRSEEKNTVALNFANGHHAGGGVEGGCAAQEESLCRRSNHFKGLKKDPNWYPLPEFGGIYCPHVTIFRKDEAHGCEFMDQPVDTAVIASAAYDLRSGHDRVRFSSGDNVPYNHQQFIDGMKRKTRNLFRVAFNQGHKHLILGAWGNGAFLIPPEATAFIFKEVLREDEFRGRFEQIDFAILTLYSSDQRNVNAFTNMVNELNQP